MEHPEMSIAQFDALMRQRHSCRSFRSEPVERSVIETVLKTAQKAPSWCNAQPWKVTITSGQETERLRQALRVAVKTEAPAPDQPFPSTYPKNTVSGENPVAGRSMKRLAFRKATVLPQPSR